MKLTFDGRMLSPDWQQGCCDKFPSLQIETRLISAKCDLFLIFPYDLEAIYFSLNMNNNEHAIIEMISVVFSIRQ